MRSVQRVAASMHSTFRAGPWYSDPKSGVNATGPLLSQRLHPTSIEHFGLQVGRVAAVGSRVCVDLLHPIDITFDLRLRPEALDIRVDLGEAAQVEGSS
jgi:hypothetical protein